MKRLYIITGANGHLAGTIIRYLRGTDCAIRGLILPSESADDDRQVTYYKGDVTKQETLAALFSGAGQYETIVIHAAGLISISDTVTPQLYQVNVEGTRNVIALCRRHHVKRLVYVSSVHAIPETDAQATIEEVSAFSQSLVTGAYAATKAEATQAVMDAVKGGLDAVIVHPSGIIGPYDSGTNHIVQLIKMYLSGRLPAGVTGGYDFVDVRDVAKGCIAAADRGKTGSCYILSNRYFSIREILDCVRKTVGGRAKVCLPIRLARAMTPFFEWSAKITHTRPLFTRYALYTLRSGGHFSHDRATSELGYHPRDMRETIAATVAWLRGQRVPLEQTS